VQVDPIKLQVDPIKLQVDPIKLQVDPIKLQVDPIKLQVDPIKLQVDSIKLQVDPFKPALTPPGTKRLILKCYEAVSDFAFNLNLRRYTEWHGWLHQMIDDRGLKDAKTPVVQVKFVPHGYVTGRGLHSSTSQLNLSRFRSQNTTSSVHVLGSTCDIFGYKTC